MEVLFELLRMTGGAASVDRNEAGEDVREFTNELEMAKIRICYTLAKFCLDFVFQFLHLIDLRDPHLELKRDSPGDDGGVAKL